MKQNGKVLLLAAKPLTHVRRVGLLAAYLSAQGLTVDVHCLVSDPRHADSSAIDFHMHSDFGVVERAKDKALRIRSNFFESRASGAKRALVTAGNLLLFPFAFFVNLICIGFAKLMPRAARKISGRISARYNRLRRRERIRIFNKNCLKSLTGQSPGTYDLVLCHDVYPAQTAQVISARDDCPLWMDIIDNLSNRSYMQSNESRPHDRAVDAALRAADVFILNSAYAPDPKAGYSAQTVQVLNANPAAVNIPPAVKPAEDAPHFIVSGTHFETSGVSRAIAFTQRYSPDAQLTIVGNFPDRNYKARIESQIAGSNLTQRVIVKPAVSPNAVLQGIASKTAVLIAFDAAHENLKTILPNRMFDAVSAQTPVIAQAGTAVAAWSAAQELGVAVDFADIDGAIAQAKTFLSRTDNAANLRRLKTRWIWENQVSNLELHLRKAGLL